MIMGKTIDFNAMYQRLAKVGAVEMSAARRYCRTVLEPVAVRQCKLRDYLPRCFNYGRDERRREKVRIGLLVRTDLIKVAIVRQCQVVIMRDKIGNSQNQLVFALAEHFATLAQVVDFAGMKQIKYARYGPHAPRTCRP